MPLVAVPRGPRTRVQTLPGRAIRRPGARAAVLAALLPLAAPAGAQPPAPPPSVPALLVGPLPPPPPAPAPAADTGRTSLTGVALTAPQQLALGALASQTRGALRALYAQAGGQSGAPLTPALRVAFDSVVAAHNAALRALLTADQRATFDANVRAVTAARRARRRPGMTAAAAVPNAIRPAVAGRTAPAGARP